MPKIAIVHPDLGMKGGAENVCLHVIEALQDKHDLTLFTLDYPNIDELNVYFETDVRPPTVRLAGRTALALNQWAGNRLSKLQSAILGRAVRRRSNSFDLVVSTKNEFPFGSDAIQYVHNPQFSSADPELTKEGVAKQVYDGGCRLVVGYNEKDVRSATLLANSDWTAENVKQRYETDVQTVYPPVDVEKFEPRSWESKEAGFVSIGRIEASKNILRNIDVVAELRERGHDVHLHIVGPTTDDGYCERVKRRAAEHNFVFFEGAVEYDKLTELIVGHRYGLHGRPYEHFGIVVAEMVAGGAVPFAPNSGGQREILNENPALLYESERDAVEKIDRMLSNPEMINEVRKELSSTVGQFNREQFKKSIREIVHSKLA